MTSYNPKQGHRPRSERKEVIEYTNKELIALTDDRAEAMTIYALDATIANLWNPISPSVVSRPLVMAFLRSARNAKAMPVDSSSWKVSDIAPEVLSAVVEWAKGVSKAGVLYPYPLEELSSDKVIEHLIALHKLRVDPRALQLKTSCHDLDPEEFMTVWSNFANSQVTHELGIANTFARQFPQYCHDCDSIDQLMEVAAAAKKLAFAQSNTVIDKAAAYRVQTTDLEIDDIVALWENAPCKHYTNIAVNWVADRFWEEKKTKDTELAVLKTTNKDLFDTIMARFKFHNKRSHSSKTKRDARKAEVVSGCSVGLMDLVKN